MEVRLIGTKLESISCSSQRCRSVLDLPDLQISSGVVIQNSPFDFLTKAISDLREKTKTLTQAAEEMTEHSKTSQGFMDSSASENLNV